MDVLLLIFVIAVPLLSAVERYHNYRLQHGTTEAQAIRQRQLRGRIAWILLIIGILTVPIAVFTFRNNAVEKKKGLIEKAESTERESDLVVRVEELSETNDRLESEVCRQNKAISDLLLVVASKPGADLNTRSEILAVKRQLDAGILCVGDWDSLIRGWKNKLAE